MHHKLRISSFNCKNVKSSMEELKTLCDASDIILLQETWLASDEILLLKNLHSDFYADGVSSLSDNGLRIGRPHGGIAVMWRKQLAQVVERVPFIDKRIMGVTLKGNGRKFLLLNVYFPCDSRSTTSENFEELMNCYGKILDVIREINSTHVFIMGDTNSGVSQASCFGNEMLSFCEDNNLILSDVALLGKESGHFTFYSDAHKSTSWIDHCMSTINAHHCIEEVKILYEYQSSDHFPLKIVITFDSTMANNLERSEVSVSDDRHIASWDKASDYHINSYHNA